MAKTNSTGFRVNKGAKGLLSVAISQYEGVKKIVAENMMEAGKTLGELTEPFVPEDTGLTVDSWYYFVEEDGDRLRLRYGYDPQVDGLNPRSYGRPNADYIKWIYQGLVPDTSIEIQFNTNRKPQARSFWLAYSIGTNRNKLIEIFKRGLE